MKELNKVFDELGRACQKFPTWPTDPFHALAVVAEEFGELSQAMLQLTYEPVKRRSLTEVKEEEIQLAAVALRFAASLDDYQFSASDQHLQQRIQRPTVALPDRDEFPENYEVG